MEVDTLSREEGGGGEGLCARGIIFIGVVCSSKESVLKFIGMQWVQLFCLFW